MNSATMTIRQKIDRQAAIVNCSANELALAVETYHHARKVQTKSPKRAHNLCAKRYGWDMATWAQDLVDLFGC